MNEEQDSHDKNQKKPEPVVTGDSDAPAILPPDLSSPLQPTPDLNMEVHHHPNVEKKGFKEYFLEFLMIFLAVTLGFIAENIREKYVEHERAGSYAVSMAGDLKADTAELKSYIAYSSYASHNIDTLMQLFAASELKQIPSGKLYWYGLYGGARRYFVANDATFQQMKSSGSLRYFEKSIAQQAAHYDQLCRAIQTEQDYDQLIYVEVRKLRGQIFEFMYNDAANNIVRANTISFDQNRIDSFIRTNPPLLTYDKSIFNQYVELVRSRFFERKVHAADSLLNYASNLLNSLQKRYNVE
jgi:hypothetical protein